MLGTCFRGSRFLVRHPRKGMRGFFQFCCADGAFFPVIVFVILPIVSCGMACCRNNPAVLYCVAPAAMNGLAALCGAGGFFIYGVIGFPVMPEGGNLSRFGKFASFANALLAAFVFTVRRCYRFPIAVGVRCYFGFLAADAALMPMACFIGFPFFIIMVFYGKADFKCL